jgi:hypothetical protein
MNDDSKLFLGSEFWWLRVNFYYYNTGGHLCTRTMCGHYK